MSEHAPGQLSPCPFCGGFAKHTAIRDGRQVFCGNCGASGPPAYRGPTDKPNALKRAIDGWNTRAQADTGEPK